MTATVAEIVAEIAEVEAEVKKREAAVARSKKYLQDLLGYLKSDYEILAREKSELLEDRIKATEMLRDTNLKSVEGDEKRLAELYAKLAKLKEELTAKN